MSKSAIDVFAHVLPPKFYQQLLQLAPELPQKYPFIKMPALSDLTIRQAHFDGRVKQVISNVNLNPEDYTDPTLAAKLCQSGNEELIELVKRYPAMFVGAVAIVPLNNLEATAEILEQVKKEPKLLAITQLTSTDERMVKEEQLITVGLEKSVENYAKLAQNAGLDGVVCSGWEANKLREVTGPEFLRVTPGIRLKTDSLGDQKRVMTPDMAAQNGSSAIVVGRPITQAKDPVTAYQAIFELWNQ